MDYGVRNKIYDHIFNLYSHNYHILTCINIINIKLTFSAVFMNFRRIVI